MKTLFEALSSPVKDDNKYNIFVIVKPGFLEDTPYIINQFKEYGWIVDKIKTKKLLLSEAKKLYEPHKKEDYFESLCNYMISDLTTGILFVKDKPINSKMFEETNKIKDIIRKKIGENEMRNGIHSSDSFDRLNIESEIYF